MVTCIDAVGQLRIPRLVLLRSRTALLTRCTDYWSKLRLPTRHVWRHCVRKNRNWTGITLCWFQNFYLSDKSFYASQQSELERQLREFRREKEQFEQNKNRFESACCKFTIWINNHVLIIIVVYSKFKRLQIHFRGVWRSALSSAFWISLLNSYICSENDQLKNELQELKKYCKTGTVLMLIG